MASCPDCGANLALVGRMHRCASKPEPMANTAPDMANAMANTYRYRDKAKRLAYMREYMRRKRAVSHCIPCETPTNSVT